MNIEDIGGRSEAWLRRYPVTITLVAALFVVALATGTVADDLSRGLLGRFGFAPRDFWAVDLWRMFSSAVITHGREVFASAVLMVTVTVGGVEHRAGSRWALATFWGVHVWTLLIMSLTLRPTELVMPSSLVERMATIRDVGPSAGYLGCLGLLFATLPHRRLRGVLVVGVLCWLGADLVGWVPMGSTPAQDVSADLAHLIAFPTGWLAGEIGTRLGSLGDGGRRKRSAAEGAGSGSEGVGVS